MAVVPNLLGTRGQFRGRQLFHGLQWGVEDGFRMIQAHYITGLFISNIITLSPSQIIRY